jgi:type II secretory pathway pseudopilin PulG
MDPNENPPQQPPPQQQPWMPPVQPHPPPKQGMSSGAIVAIVLGCVFGGIMILGILAAVAIPAFMKNSRKAKTSEPVINVKKLYEGARAYYEEEANLRGSITPIPKQFPNTPSPATQPALGSCCMQPGGKCAPDIRLWTDPSWQALRFSMDDPHYYSYTFESTGTDMNAQFSARANGDLDCDASYSTFEMVGSIQLDGTVTGSAGFFRDQQLE